MFSVDAGVCVQKLYVSLSALHGASESSQMTSPRVPCMSEHDEKGHSFCARLRMRGLFCFNRVFLDRWPGTCKACCRRICNKPKIELRSASPVWMPSMLSCFLWAYASLLHPGEVQVAVPGRFASLACKMGEVCGQWQHQVS